MPKYVCPGCHGVIESTSETKLSKWIANHTASCPTRTFKKET